MGGPAEAEAEEQPRYSAEVIIAIAILSIMTAALTAFVILWLWEISSGECSLSAYPSRCSRFLSFDCVFYKAKGLEYIISAFIVSLFFIAYFAKPDANLWQLFLICVPAVVLTFLGCNVRVKPKKSKKKHNE